MLFYRVFLYVYKQKHQRLIPSLYEGVAAAAAAAAAVPAAAATAAVSALVTHHSRCLL